MKDFEGHIIVSILFVLTLIATGCTNENNASTWVKMFRGVGDTQYSSSGVTDEDAFMFAEACVGYATQISGNKEMVIRYVTAITGMSMSFVNGWTRKSEEDQNAYILDKYVYAIDRLKEEVSVGKTTWDKVEYVCSDALSD